MLLNFFFMFACHMLPSPELMEMPVLWLLLQSRQTKMIGLLPLQYASPEHFGHLAGNNNIINLGMDDPKPTSNRNATPDVIGGIGGFWKQSTICMAKPTNPPNQTKNNL
jgi:hypothetical protein